MAVVPSSSTTASPAMPGFLACWRRRGSGPRRSCRRMVPRLKNSSTVRWTTALVGVLERAHVAHASLAHRRCAVVGGGSSRPRCHLIAEDDRAGFTHIGCPLPLGIPPHGWYGAQRRRQVAVPAGSASGAWFRPSGARYVLEAADPCSPRARRYRNREIEFRRINAVGDDLAGGDFPPAGCELGARARGR